jgi:hypothetical protein
MRYPISPPYGIRAQNERSLEQKADSLPNRRMKNNRYSYGLRKDGFFEEKAFKKGERVNDKKPFRKTTFSNSWRLRMRRHL